MTLYDLIADDHYIWASKNKENSDISIEVMNDEDEVIYQDQTAPAGWESLVRFAEQVIRLNEKMGNK